MSQSMNVCERSRDYNEMESNDYEIDKSLKMILGPYYVVVLFVLLANISRAVSQERRVIHIARRMDL